MTPTPNLLADAPTSTQPSAELLPCPFCGGDAIYEQDRSDGPRSLRWSAGCRIETCMGYMGPTFPRRKDAAEAWNTRAKPPSVAGTSAVIGWTIEINEDLPYAPIVRLRRPDGVAMVMTQSDFCYPYFAALTAAQSRAQGGVDSGGVG